VDSTFAENALAAISQNPPDKGLPTLIFLAGARDCDRTFRGDIPAAARGSGAANAKKIPTNSGSKETPLKAPASMRAPAPTGIVFTSSQQRLSNT